MSFVYDLDYVSRSFENKRVRIKYIHFQIHTYIHPLLHSSPLGALPPNERDYSSKGSHVDFPLPRVKRNAAYRSYDLRPDVLFA